MATTSIQLKCPPGFAFRSTVWSHGWFDLAPFAADRERRSLALTLEFRPGRVARATLVEAAAGVSATLEAARPLGSAELATARRMLSSILRLDEDLRPFYRAIADDPRLAWVEEKGAGRLLRAPTAWEDLVKLLLTTNCSWALTRAMTRNLVEGAGAGSERLGHAFPAAAAIADRPEDWFREVVRCGYRSASLKELARRVASGELDPERWREPGIPAAEIEREIASVKGAGPYVIGSLLRLMGRYRHLALDSWARARWARLNHRKRPNDRAIIRALGRHGEWQGLALWMELTEQWYAKESWDPLQLGVGAS